MDGESVLEPESASADSSSSQSSGESESNESSGSSDTDGEGSGTMLLDKSELQAAINTAAVCSDCHGALTIREDPWVKQGLFTSPHFICKRCHNETAIHFPTLGGNSRALAINRRIVFANKCIGGTRAGLDVFCSILDLPNPVSQKPYAQHVEAVKEKAILQAKDSMKRANKEVREHYDCDVGDDEVADILVSCDGTWQRRGFSSLYGAVFIIAHETGKVIDYIVLSRHCTGCQGKDEASPEYQEWKLNHVCDANFSGSAGAMEPLGTVELFKRSLNEKIRYKYLIADGDSKTHTLLLQEQPYGTDGEHQVEKKDCVGHIQKRMGTALRELKKRYGGKKLDDGKTIGGVGRLTYPLIDTLQNYYGDAIKSCKGNINGMVRAVQSSLLHLNSTDQQPHHHLCPTGPDSWCKWQKAKAKNETYHHKKAPIPPAIVAVVKPTYARLGSRALLEKCVDGYTQNANEGLHNLVWRFCPKDKFMGRTGVEIECALAVCIYNDGALSLAAIAKRFNWNLSTRSRRILKSRDQKSLKSSKYKASDKAKQLRRKARRRKKALSDKRQRQEGVMYSSGSFDTSIPGPSSAQD